MLNLVEFTKKYSDEAECKKFFFNMKYPDGYVCPKCGGRKYYSIKRHNVTQCAACGHQEYLFANTIFEKNKIKLYTLLLGLYLVFTSKHGYSAKQLARDLGVNYKTALLLNRKCRILMSEATSNKILDAAFYEADTVYYGSKSEGDGKQGCGTDQQPFLAILSLKRQNNNPQYIKFHVIPTDNGSIIEKIITKSIKYGKDRTLTTDGKTTFQSVRDLINLDSQKINYKEVDHPLYWTNIFVGNIKNNITGIYHGVAKRYLPLFLNEQAWRLNHRFTTDFLEKISNYIIKSTPMPNRIIKNTLQLAEPFFSKG